MAVRLTLFSWLTQYFTHHGFGHEILALPTNEANKSFELVFQVADALEKFGINRHGAVVSYGLPVVAQLTLCLLLLPSSCAMSVMAIFAGCITSSTDRVCRRRKEPIIAIGGGVCLDVAGLAANLFRRNTPLIKVRSPYALLAQGRFLTTVPPCHLRCWHGHTITLSN